MHHLDESLLALLPLFAGVKRPALRTMLDQATSKRFDAGKTVFAEGTPADRFFLLLDGTVRVVKIGPDGEQVTSLHIPSGQMFGIGQALGHTTYPATAVTASDCVVLSWPSKLWGPFTTSNPSFREETFKTVGTRINQMNNRIFELSKLHVEQRVARALLRLADQSGKTTEQGVEINFAITRQDVSDMTGTTLHTVSRLLSAWEKAGWVSSARKKITIRAQKDLLVLSEK